MIKRTAFYVFAVFLVIFGYQPQTGADYSCAIAVDEGVITTTCQEPVTIVKQDNITGRALARIDMQSVDSWQCLKVTALIVRPDGIVLNIGNSPTNNGYGGDEATFSNDSEMEIAGSPEKKSGALRLYHNDYSTGPSPMMTVDDIISQFSILELEFGDQYFYAQRCDFAGIPRFLKDNFLDDANTDYENFIRSCRKRKMKNVKLQSEHIFRLGGDDAEAGTNDYIYWMGINGVVSFAASRSGAGVKKIVLDVSTDTCEP